MQPSEDLTGLVRKTMNKKSLQCNLARNQTAATYRDPNKLDVLKSCKATETHQQVSIVRQHFRVQKIFGIIMVLHVYGVDVYLTVADARQTDRVLCKKIIINK